MPSYRLTLPDRATHHVDVELRVKAAENAKTIDVWMPAWTPGSYLIREFTRHLRRWSATGAGGRTLTIERRDKAGFRIHCDDGETVSLAYRVYTNELTVRTSYADESCAVLNGASVFVAPAGREHEECRVEIVLPDGWTAITGLALAAGEASTFVARDFAELIDCPIALAAAGYMGVADFVAGGKQHQFAILGSGNHDLPTTAEDTRRIVEAATSTFGPLPYADYRFILFTTRDVQSGLEHHNSTLLAFPRFSFRDDKGRTDLLGLIAHEHFHAWNVKRTRPRDFVPYDLRNETYTRALWICEGVTSYYDELLLLRAGLVDRNAYLARLAEELSRYVENPGRLEQSLEEASLTTWTRYYRQDEDYPNSAISYYQKGALVSLLLDLEIRAASSSQRSLDDVMRALFERFPRESEGFTPEEFESLASEIAGKDLRAFFDAAVRGTGELDFARPLEQFGVRLDQEERQPAPTARDWIGIRVKAGASPLKIDVVERASAAERGGLLANDEIIAIDGLRVPATTLGERLKDARGRAARLSVFRDDHLVERTVAVPAVPSRVVKLVVAESAAAECHARLDRWLGPQLLPVSSLASAIDARGKPG